MTPAWRLRSLLTSNGPGSRLIIAVQTGEQTRSVTATWSPAVGSLAALNQLIAAADMVDDGRVITGRPVTIVAAFADEQLAMAPLPARPFDPARLLRARVDGRARVCVRQNTTPSRPAMSAAGCRCGCRYHGRGARRTAGSGPARARRWEVRRDLGPGPLPGGPASQARRSARGAALGQARVAGAFTAAHQGPGTPPAASMATRPGHGR